MEKIGTVVEIIGGSMILVKSESPRSISVDDVFKVYAEIEIKELTERHDIPFLQIPKGEIRVVAKQLQGYFIAESFRPMVSASRVVDYPSAGLLSGLLAPKVVEESRPGPPSAILGNPTIDFQMSKKVEAGDKVGRD